MLGRKIASVLLLLVTAAAGYGEAIEAYRPGSRHHQAHVLHVGPVPADQPPRYDTPNAGNKVIFFEGNQGFKPAAAFG